MTQANVLAQLGSPGISTGFKNRIINGAMVIAQRGTSFTGLTDTDSQYTIDRWRWAESGSFSGVCSVTQSTDAPAGFINSFKFETTTAQASFASSDSVRIEQFIEGYNLSDLAWGTSDAKTITISFWVKASLTGTFGGVVENNANDRSYPFTYSIASANTWEYKSVTIPGDTSGTWLTDNLIGIRLRFALGAGSGLSATAGAWAAGNYHSATGAVALASTLNSTFYITGVQLEVGTSATDFEYRPYGTELQLCERYYQKLGDFYISAYNSTNEPTGGTSTFKTSMRTTPTIAYPGGTASTNAYGLTVDNITDSSYRAYMLVTSAGRIYFSLTSVIASAEL